MASGQLCDTRRRIRSVEATKKITRAMELIAAARIPKAQARVQASKPYSAKLVDVMRNAATAAGGVENPLLAVREEERTIGILCVSSDRGLCGAYATTIIRAAERSILEHLHAGRRVQVFAVGKKASSYFAYKRYPIARTFLGVTDTPGYGDARAIAAVVMEAYASGAVDRVEAYYTQYKSALTQEPTLYQLLPVQPPGEEAGEQRSVDYSYEPSPAEILDRLVPRYVEAVIFSMLLEASASEHAARRRAMKAATDNAEELIRALTVQANRQRQAEITTAITEIVSGAQALKEA